MATSEHEAMVTCTGSNLTTEACMATKQELEESLANLKVDYTRLFNGVVDVRNRAHDARTTVESLKRRLDALVLEDK